MMDDLDDAVDKAVARDAPVQAGVRVEGKDQTLTTKPSAEAGVDWESEFRDWGLDPNEWMVTGDPRISIWDAQVKGGEIVRMHAWKATIRRISDVEGDNTVAMVRQATPIAIKQQRVKKPALKTDGWRTAVIMPDAQRPFHDPAAVDVALQILNFVHRSEGVDDIIHLGDDLDLPDFGKHRSAPDVCGQINDAIEQQYRVLATERAMCPDARLVWVAGNHENRVTNWLVDHAPMLLGLQRPDQDDPNPILSIPFLCRLDELNVEYLDPYPEGELWLNDHLRCIHGSIAKSQLGATAAHYLNQGNVSTIYGHIHRSELLYQTRHTRRGPRTYMAGSPGSLCKLDGSVPSTRSGINARGEQGRTSGESWQNGIWVLSYQTDGPQLFSIEPVQIWDGWAHFRGKSFAATEVDE